MLGEGEHPLKNKAALRFPDMGLPQRHLISLDVFSDENGTSRYLYDLLSGGAEVHISVPHQHKMFEYLEYKLDMKASMVQTEIVIWNPEWVGRSYNKSFAVDDMKLDSETLWNFLLTVCYGDD